MRHAVNRFVFNRCRQARAFHRLALLACALAMIPAGFAAAQTTARPRQLAPGVLTTIPPGLAPADTVSTHDVVEIRNNPTLTWKPEYLAASDTLVGMSSATKFRREIWGLEFSFKPLRMIDVNGQKVWYLVYRVRNTGASLVPTRGENGIYTAVKGPGQPRRFVPEFVLESHDRAPDGKRVRRSYFDQIIPSAVAAISRRETPGRMLLDNAQMAQQLIPLSSDRVDRGVWGVATWTNVDPRMDFYSVYVGGLTNAYRWEDAPGAYRPGDPPGRGRTFARKTLQLNFWRPGDEYHQSEREIRYGVPLDNARLYDVGDGVAHRWVYR